ATVGGQRDFALVRLNADGSADGSFGAGGRVLLDLGGDDVLTALAVQADGSVVAAGTTSSAGGSDVVVVRLRPDGSLDPRFGVGGVFRLDVAGGADEAHAVALQADGKVLVAGSTVLASAGR